MDNDGFICYEIPSFNSETGRWEVVVKNGDDIKVNEFCSEEEAIKSSKLDVDDLIDKKDKKKKKVLKEELNRQESILEQKIREHNDNNKGSNKNTESGKNDIFEEDVERQIKDFKIDFDKRKEKCNLKAKSVLNEIAKFYLGQKIFTRNDCAKYISEVEEMNLSSLMFQLNVAHEGIFKLSQYIHLGAMNTRLWEVMGNLQRTILDITKYMHEYLIDMGATMKTMKEDILNGLTGDIEELDDKPGNNNHAKALPDRKEIISEMSSMLNEINAYMVIPSANKKLSMTYDIQSTETAINNVGTDDLSSIEVDSSGGLSTFEDDD